MESEYYSSMPLSSLPVTTSMVKEEPLSPDCDTTSANTLLNELFAVAANVPVKEEPIEQTNHANPTLVLTSTAAASTRAVPVLTYPKVSLKVEAENNRKLSLKIIIHGISWPIMAYHG